MPPNDQEPRYRLVDANGNVVGSLFLNGNGDVAIQDESGTETAFTTDGISTPAVDTDSISTTTETIETRSDYPLNVGDDARIVYDAADADSGNRGLRTLTSAKNVDTSSTTLASNILNTFVAFISGGDGSSNRFVDRVAGSAFGGVTQTELHTRQTPASRSYAENSGELELSMASGSYQVSVWILRFDFI